MYSECFPLLLLLLTIGSLIVVRLHKVNQARTRTAQLWRVANALGLDFFPEASTTYLAKFAGAALFPNKYRKRIFNLMTGCRGQFEVLLFDYTADFDRLNWLDTDNTKIYRTIICFRFSENRLPHFKLQPKKFWHSLGKVVGQQEINISCDASFSARYWLQGEDEKAIQALFTKELCAFYKTKSGVSTEVANGYFFYYRNNVRIDPEELPAFLGEALDAFMLCLDAIKST